ncbi:GntR family transcriptional regulator [Pelosinus sp. UFO1]|uniref:GntR family transcriptional regulator n=1 Tax=Pelosinus sp. UFO1 TaxID=484770 RepID=UPI0004D1C222|nr:GntR family transcriptional regulator [Pelosinus sp. UFO1]AIF52620.1 transcriptional regulator, GntR family [Pelosinus sp. UFO1]
MILQRVGIPIYLQIKSYVLDKIKSGEYLPGAKIPTERELSTILEVSRNTVSAAYKELLLEGVLEAQQGRGTYVKNTTDDANDTVVGGKRERLVKIIDEAMSKVVELGFTVDQFAAIASIRAIEKNQAVKELRVAVVDCASEYIQRFINQIGQIANVRFETVILSELVAGKIPIELLQACDLVVTTLVHQTTVVGLMGNAHKVIGVATVPNLEAVIKLARLPANTQVPIVAKSNEFVANLKKLLEKTAINHLDFKVIQSSDYAEVSAFIADYKVVIVSEEREMLVRQMVSDVHEVITFYYEIDRGSLNQVMMKLISQAL